MKNFLKICSNAFSTICGAIYIVSLNSIILMTILTFSQIVLIMYVAKDRKTA